MTGDSALDLYCERTSADFWAEPVNALSNLAFIIAAIAIALLMRRSARVSAASIFLVVNLAAIGTGSFLFHTLATRTTMLADLLPIFVYQLAFLFLYSRHVAGCTASVASGLMGVLILVSLAFLQFPKDILNGSLLYGGALLFMGGIAIYHHASGKHEPATLYLATLVFAASLALRSIDLSICGDFPLGSHFLWHLLNGFVLYLSTRAYVLNQATGEHLAKT